MSEVTTQEPLFAIQEQVSLKPFHTFALPARARYFCRIKSEAALLALRETALFQAQPCVFLGEGSNTLFQQDFPGLVVKLEIKGIKVVYENDQSVHLKVMAGENWHELVQHTLQQQWFGLENLSLIPGTAGAAPIQNIGAYGVELKDVLLELSALELQTGKTVIFSNEDCCFAYRDSRFKRQAGRYVITSITLKLSKQPVLHLDYASIQEELRARHLTHPTPQQLSELICTIRRQKLPDPAVLPNAGSFFKNPVVSAAEYQRLRAKFPDLKSQKVSDNDYKIPAGWLLESCGFKGKKINNISVYEKQALVLVNNGKASGNDLVEAIQLLIAAVQDKFGLSLEVEPQIY